MNYLPPEIITRSLRLCDKSTLTSCCLVNASIRKIAQTLLFHSLFVGRPLLTAILAEQFPYLHLVQVMHTKIQEYMDPEFTLLVEKLATHSAKRPFKLHVEAQEPIDEDIEAIMDALQNVPASSSFLVLHTTLSMTEDDLVFDWRGDALNIIKDVHIIENIHAEPPEDGDIIRPVVQTLQLDFLPPFDQLCQRLNLEHLRRLFMSNDLGAPIEELIRHTAPSLEVISLSCPDDLSTIEFQNETFTYPDLKFPKLKDVTLWVSGAHGPIESSLIPTISNISLRASSIECISICIFFFGIPAVEEEINSFWLPLFDPHSPLVMALDNLPKLRHVEFSLDLNPRQMATKEKWLEMNGTIRRSLHDRSYTIDFLRFESLTDFYPFFDRDF
ncbi:hypothetical protein DL96DRAFT_127476 [Flagelloscypha sp. PMI_526]|nr:hypothetical protein DL96DRAFT_127476 [Flagelloscypha sp. PMI_526]